MEVKLSLPSKEGLNIASNISILYRIDKVMVPTLIENIGTNIEDIISVFFARPLLMFVQNTWRRICTQGKDLE